MSSGPRVVWKPARAAPKYDELKEENIEAQEPVEEERTMARRIAHGFTMILLALVIFAIFGMVIALVVRGNGSTSTASVASVAPNQMPPPINPAGRSHASAVVTPISSAQGCVAGYEPTANDITCKHAIPGAGPAGLYAALRLIELGVSGSDICLIDNRDHFGGKVQPVEAPNSSPSNPLFSPSHAEQLLGHHATMRCLAQEYDLETYIRGSWSRRFKRWEILTPAGYNTSNICPECWSFSAEKLAAPNGIPNPARYASQLNGGQELQGLPDMCNGLDYTQCSYSDNMVEAIIKAGNEAKNHPVFADFTRHLFGSSEAANNYWSFTTGYGYITSPHEAPVQAVAGHAFVDEDWNSPSGGFYWPRGGPAQIWKAVKGKLDMAGVRFYMNEEVQCFDKATDSQATTLRYVLRTNKRNVRASRVVWATTAGQFTDLVKGTYGPQLAARKEMRALSGKFAQCSFEMFFPNKWWLPANSRATDAFCIDPACNNYTIIDTPGIRNYTEWIYYDAINGYWFRYQPIPDIQEMNLIRMLPDHCEEFNAAYVRGGLTVLNKRVLTYLRDTFGPTGLTVPDFTKTYFSYEKYGFSHFNADTDATIPEIVDFAQQPDSQEKVCFAGESWQWGTHAGWMQGAIQGVHNCFRGPALGDLLTSAQKSKIQDNWESCKNSRGETLSTKSASSTSNPCLRLDNEKSLASMAGIEYCPQLVAKRSTSETNSYVPHPVRDRPHAMDRTHRA